MNATNLRLHMMKANIAVTATIPTARNDPKIEPVSVPVLYPF
jgi:hypothetical protein